MRKLNLLSKKSVLIQGGLLSVLLGFVLTARVEPASAGGDCPEEEECSFKKPNFMIILDYSSSMNEAFGNGTRWENAVDAVNNLVVSDNGFFSDNMHLALMRFGHDPDPFSPGTGIQGDQSGIVDGQSLDVPWYDANSNDKTYFGCNGDELIASLEATPPPLCQPPGCSGVGTWTKGALDFATDIIIETQADHPNDLEPGDERWYGLMVITDGAWTDQVGFPQLFPPEQNPALSAGNLFDNLDVPTYVVAVAEAANLEFANELAEAGGTGEAIGAENPQAVVDAVGGIIEEIKDAVIVPECIEGLPRLMVILDASSSMLDVGDMHGMMGETGWDKARVALAGEGDDSLFQVPVPEVGEDKVLEDLVHLGMIVFGAPGEQKVSVQYGPCMRDNFDWALDPVTSCEQPGCDDPWGGPPITWTFKDGSEVEPFFDQETLSHMPQCQPFNLLCAGSGTFTHLGLELALQNLIQYQNDPPPGYPIDDSTRYVNILITDGQYSTYSTDEQVQNALEGLFFAGVKTYVIGFGDGLDTPEAEAQLANMADWGSNGDEPFYDANSQAQLETALSSIVADIDFDVCCGFNDCSENPEPTTQEPDPTAGDDGFGDDGNMDAGDAGDDGNNDAGDDGLLDTGGDDGDGDGGDAAEDGDAGEDGDEGNNDAGDDGGNDGGGDDGLLDTGGDDGDGDGGDAAEDGDAGEDGDGGNNDAGDAGTGGDGYEGGSGSDLIGRGCGCSTPGGAAGGAGGLALLGLLGGSAIGRRRRRRSS